MVNEGFSRYRKPKSSADRERLSRSIVGYIYLPLSYTQKRERHLHLKDNFGHRVVYLDNDKPEDFMVFIGAPEDRKAIVGLIQRESGVKLESI